MLSILLCIAMLLSCMTFAIVPAMAEGATYATDAEAVTAGYSFKVGTAYYKTLAECYDAVEDGGTITMIANYKNASGCEYVGGDNPTTVKTYTIEGGNFTYTSSNNHPLHFYNSNVTVNQMNVTVSGDGNIAGPRIEYNSTVTIKNSTWQKTGLAEKDWNPAIVVYGTLILDDGAVVKNNGANAGSKNHGIYTEGKKHENNNDAPDASIIPVVILKKGSSIEACNYVFYESTKASITVESFDVTLTSKTITSGLLRRTNASTTVTMSGPTTAEMSNEATVAKWKNLYTKMGVEWASTEVAQVGTTKFYTLASALNSVTDGCTVKLLTNVELTGTVSCVPSSAVNFTLDGDGHSITGGDFSLLTIGANATCTLKNITLSNKNGGKTGTLNILGNVTLDNGVKITNAGGTASGNSQYVGISMSQNGSKLTINEGVTIDVQGTALKSDGITSDIVLNGGTVKTAFRGYVTNAGTSTLTINSGSLTTTNTSQNLIFVWGSTGKFTFNGGTIATGGGDIYNKGSGNATLTVNDGKFTVGSATYTVGKFYGYSLSLNDDIGMNFYTATGLGVAPTVTIDGKAVTGTKTADKFGIVSLYKFSVGVTASEMTKELTASLTYGTSTDTVKASVKGYATQLLADSTQTANAKALVTAMLHYGASAQTLFGKNTDSLANAGLDAQDTTSVTAKDAWKATESGSQEGITYYGMSLLLKDKTTLRHWFKLDSGKTVADFTFKLGEVTLTAVAWSENASYCYVDITGIKSSELATAKTVTVGGLTVTASALSYAKEVLSQTAPDANLLSAMKALVLYANSAVTYFAQ